jgi:hypothetical protein
VIILPGQKLMFCDNVLNPGEKPIHGVAGEWVADEHTSRESHHHFLIVHHEQWLSSVDGERPPSFRAA